MKTGYIQRFRFQFTSRSFPAKPLYLKFQQLCPEKMKRRHDAADARRFVQILRKFKIMGAVPTRAPKLAEQIEHHALKAGFDLCGIVSAETNSNPPELDYFQQWIAEGQAGEMEYLNSRNDRGELKRAALRNAVPWVKSVVVCAINYNSSQPYSIEMSDSERGWISRYAWFRPGKSADGQPNAPAPEKATADYHDAVLRRLRQVEAKLHQDWSSQPRIEELQTRCYVDTGPIVERVWAKYAGVGWIGKNTCIINEEIGSWLFLGVILTSLEQSQLGGKPVAEGDSAARDAVFDLPAADRCGSCTRCLDACPTGALTAPYKMDARKCIAYLTIEKRGKIPEELRSQMGHHIFGCDICQDVCPWNVGYKRSQVARGQEVVPHRAPVTGAAEFEARQDLVHPPLQWLANMSREEFNSTFRASPIKRAKYAGIRRNTAVAMGNSGNSEFIPELQKLAQDSDANVAEHARWALARLQGE